MLLTFIRLQVWENHTMPPPLILDNIFQDMQNFISMNIRSSARQGERGEEVYGFNLICEGKGTNS